MKRLQQDDKGMSSSSSVLTCDEKRFIPEKDFEKEGEFTEYLIPKFYIQITASGNTVVVKKGIDLPSSGRDSS